MLQFQCFQTPSWVPELISVLLSILLIFATMKILNWYQKKEEKAENNLQENPLQADEENPCCIIL